MKSVNVNRVELLLVMKENLDKHMATHSEAMIAYREKTIARLTEMLSDAKNGGTIESSTKLIRPESHESNYRRVISMLEMSVDNIITLDPTEYDQYVLDNWYWKDDFLKTSSFYGAIK